MVSAAPRFAMVAGEASGDLLAGLLLDGMNARWPALKSFGIGGPKMAARGFTAWWPHDKLAVRGYVEVLRHYREIVGIRKQLAARLLADPPDAFIGVDAPDFNLHLEATLKARGIKTIHFVGPSIWAWHGVAATFVGHPLADAIPLDVPRAASRAALGLASDSTVVALLPGSRRSEIACIAPGLLAAAAEMHRQRPQLRFVLPVVPGLRGLVEPLRQQWAADVPVTLLDGRSHEALAACDVALVASGTATLEAALFKRPMVITYTMHWLSWQMMKRMKYQPWVGLPNILLNDFAVPELLQDAATPTALAAAAFEWLDDAPARAALTPRFEALHHSLRRNTAQAASHAIEKILGA